jgi:type VI secretion system secreted protein VgrG
MAEYLEENRYLYIQSGLGPNELLLESFTGTEAVSTPFQYQLELLSENQRIKFEEVLGKPISFGVLGLEDNEPRFIHGIVTSFTQLPGDQRLSRYRAIVSPKLSVLKIKRNMRIFQKITVPDILKKMLEGFDVSWELHLNHPEREYCVQYRETDFNFVSRLMEEEGIFYFFKHSKNAHKMIVADSPVSHPELLGNKVLSYDEVSSSSKDEGHISQWVKTQELGTGKYSLRDYCYGTPSTDMSAEESILESVQIGKVTHRLKVGGNDQFEIYDYPGGYGIREQGEGEKATGKALVKLGIEQLEMSQFLIQGESNVINITAGYKFNLKRYPDADGVYVFTKTTLSAREGGFHSGTIIGDNHFGNIFECIPYSLHFRPAQKSFKPRVQGCQTAVVVGPSGEEIYTDDHGRIKVQFHWDREGKKDASSSCWIRVSTLWAGEQWGMIHLPRIGQEVIVDFLEGDPDCPIVIGSVYNGSNVPPYPLPGSKTQSGVISRTMFGGADNFNEIRFEDKAGSEEIHVHAEKDMSVEIEHDRTTKIDHDDTINITNDRKTVIKGNDTTNITKNMHTTADGQIVLECGSSKITMKPSGEIKIEGNVIKVISDGTIESKASATQTIKGAIVNIN